VLAVPPNPYRPTPEAPAPPRVPFKPPDGGFPLEVRELLLWGFSPFDDLRPDLLGEGCQRTARAYEGVTDVSLVDAATSGLLEDLRKRHSVGERGR
jgi:hypothetical protein